MKVSIIIPTYNKLDLLKECVESVIKYTDLTDKEILVISNGCKDGTLDYLRKRCDEIENMFYAAYEDPLGYPKAINRGIEAASGDYIVLLNNDTVLMAQEIDFWINLLLQPFLDSDNVAVSGPLKAHSKESGFDFILFFCAMIRKDLLADGLDETFGKGFGEDIDFCAQAQQLGFSIKEVPDKSQWAGTSFSGSFPIYHQGGRTVKEVGQWEENVTRNLKILELRYTPINKNRVNVVIPTYKRYEQLMVAVKSVLEQTYSEEIIIHVCSDGYDEIVEEMVKSFSDLSGENRNLKYYHTEEREGLCGGACREKVLNELSDGELVCFIDDDDCMFPTFVEKLSFDISQTHQIAYCLTDHKILGRDVPDIQRHEVGKFEFGDISSQNFMLTTSLAKMFSDKWIQNPDEEVNHDFNFIVACKDLTNAKFRSETLSSTNQDNYEIRKYNVFSYKEIFNMNIYDTTEENVCGKTVVDIGGFVGYYALDCAEKGAKRIKIYEPNSVNFKHMGFVLGDKENVEKYNYAVAGKDDESVFISNKNVESKVSRDEGDFEVKTICLDTIYDDIEENDTILKMDCEEMEYEILENTSDETFSKIEYIHIEIHDVDENKNNETLLRFLESKGFCIYRNNPMMGYFYTVNGETVFEKGKINTYNLKRKVRVSAVIPTKNRYETTLSLAINAVLMQTYPIHELIIFDDGEHRVLRDISPYKELFQLMDLRGIKWKCLFTPNAGQVYAHNQSIEEAEGEWIWRVDDDNVPEPNVLEKLVSEIKSDVGAVAGLVMSPDQLSNPPISDSKTNLIEDVNYNYQWYRHENREPLQAEHLYSSFIYRKKAATHGYCKELSVIGHREETIFTHEMYRNGWKLIVTPNAITHHFRQPSGGIREQDSASFWEDDDRVFSDYIKKWKQDKIEVEFPIVLDCGMGDHVAFKMVFPEVKKRHSNKKIVVYPCYPQLFEGEEGFEIRPLHEAMNKWNTPQYNEFNIYKKMIDWNWNGHICDAFRRMYL